MQRKITREELVEVKKLDLLTYLTNFEPDELIKSSKFDYVTRSESSLHISNGLWMWWTKGIGGRSALDYLIKVREMTFLDASLFLNDLLKCNTIATEPQEIKQKKEFKMPQPANSDDAIIEYLMHERCIGIDILQHHINRYNLYESMFDHSVIFVGYDEDGIARYANKRATDSQEKRDIGGSNKKYGFSSIDKDSEILHVFESAIDLLSYQSMLQIKGKNWLENSYLSIAGATKSATSIEDSTLPVALEFFISTHEISTIVLHLDNDIAGIECSKKIKELLKIDYVVIDRTPSNHKDVNDALQCYIRNKSKMQGQQL